MIEPSRFLIAGTQRTGTTLLRTSLSSHPLITCHGEVFKLGRIPYTLPGGFWAYSRSSFVNRIRTIVSPRRACWDFLSRLYGDQRSRATGFKLMLNQCESMPYLWTLIRRFPVRCILVTRRNCLKTFVSRAAAAASGIYHVSATLPAKSAVKGWVAQPVTLDPDTIIRELDEISSEPVRWRSRLEDVPTLEIAYETYVYHQSTCNDRVLDFLAMPRQPLSSDLKKVNPDRLSESIANYDEIADLVGKSPYAFCLSDDD